MSRFYSVARDLFLDDDGSPSLLAVLVSAIALGGCIGAVIARWPS